MLQFYTVGLGEILWDMLPQGKQLGGAPANFAYHTQQLGARATVISAVGNDELGREINRIIDARQLGNCIALSTKPTGTVSVSLVDGIPSYTIHEDVAWDNISLNADSIKALSRADAICFGSLAQRSPVSRNSIRQALELSKPDALRVFDINLRQHYYSAELIEQSLQLANVFKINDEELVVLANLFGLSGSDESIAQQLMNRYALKLLAVTRGAKNSSLYTATEQSDIDTPRVNVADTIGAGDSFTATLCMGMLQGKSLSDLHQHAVQVSAFVCSQAGAMPVLPEGLR